MTQISSFTSQQFELNNCLGLAHKLESGAPLDLLDCLKLWQLSLPLLGKLVEIRFPATRAEKNPFVRPTLLLPISHLLETKGSTETLQTVHRRIDTVLEQIAPPEPLFILVDRWSGRYSFQKLINVLQEISLGGNQTYLRILGPTTNEIDDLFNSKSRRALEANAGISISLEQFFDSIKNAGVHSIEGGDNLEMHQQAIQAGFTVSIGQNVNAINMQLEQVIENIFSIRELVQNSPRIQTWFPHCQQLPDLAVPGISNQSSPLKIETGIEIRIEILGIDIIKLIAIGRLILADVKYIRAPTNIFGEKLAHLALNYGANDLGFAAVDTDTSDELATSKLSDVVDLINSGRKENDMFTRLTY